MATVFIYPALIRGWWSNLLVRFVVCPWNILMIQSGRHLMTMLNYQLRISISRWNLVWGIQKAMSAVNSITNQRQATMNPICAENQSLDMGRRNCLSLGLTRLIFRNQNSKQSYALIFRLTFWNLVWFCIHDWIFLAYNFKSEELVD